MARGIFGIAGRFWATALRRTHPKKSLRHTRPYGGTADKHRYKQPNYFRKELILPAFWGQNYYHMIKYIMFKSSSLKYNEVSHYHLYLIRELPVYRNTAFDQPSSSG